MKIIYVSQRLFAPSLLSARKQTPVYKMPLWMRLAQQKKRFPTMHPVLIWVITVKVHCFQAAFLTEYIHVVDKAAYFDRLSDTLYMATRLISRTETIPTRV